MRSSQDKILLAAALWVVIAACGGSGLGALPPAPTSSLAEAGIEPVATATVGAGDATDSSTLPADVETYYKTMVFIEGTGQVMGKLDLNQWTSNSVEFMAVMGIPAAMDDRVVWTQKEPLPDSLGAAWDKALGAEQALMASLENMMMMQLQQEEFLQVVAENTALASEAVAEAEAVLAAEGASPEQIEALKRAALTEMGEAYKGAASLIVVVETQAAGDSD